MYTISSWFHEHAKIHDPMQALPLILQSFQDDLLEVAVAEQAEKIVEEVQK